MTWQKKIDLYYNVDAPGYALVDPLADGVRPATTPIMIAGDHLTLRVHLRQWDSTANPPAWQSIAIPAGTSLVFAGKPLTALSQANVLFLAQSFTENSGVYEAELDLNTDAVATAMGAAAEIRIRTDLELQNADNTRRATLQADITLRQEAYDGTEGVPSPGNPPYPASHNILLRQFGGIQLIDADDATITLDYSHLSLATAPAAILLTVRKPSAESPQLTVNLVAAASSTEQTVAITGWDPVESGAYYLHYMIIPGSAAVEELTQDDVILVTVDGVERLAHKFPDDNYYAMIPVIVDGAPTHRWQQIEDPT